MRAVQTDAATKYLYDREEEGGLGCLCSQSGYLLCPTFEKAIAVLYPDQADEAKTKVNLAPDLERRAKTKVKCR